MNEKLKRLEKKFKLAEEAVKEFEEEEITFTPIVEKKEIVNSETGEIMIPETEEDIEKVFKLEELKKDFLIIRQTLLSTILFGQEMLNKCSKLEVTDMKSAQLDSLCNLQNTVGNNLKLMISIYKEISSIEQERSRDKLMGNGTTNPAMSINQGTVNNVYFTGTTEELLELLDKDDING